MSDLASRVRRGALLLDDARPGWAERVNLDRLAMHTCDRCILGQVYGDFADGYKLAIRPLPSSLMFRSSHFGFTLPGEEQRGPDIAKAMLRFAALADCWRAEVRARLEEGGGA